MSLVNEAVVDAAIRGLADSPWRMNSGNSSDILRKRTRDALEAAAPHIGGEAIRQAVVAEREQIKRLSQSPERAVHLMALDDVLKHAEVTG